MTRVDSENIKAAHTLRELGLDPETASGGDPVIRLIADRARLAAEVARLTAQVAWLREALADATEWKSMDTAPTDGKHVIVAVPMKGGFVYAVEGAFKNGRWMNALDSDEAPLCWRHKPLIPAVFLPWTEEFAAEARRKGGAA